MAHRHKARITFTAIMMLALVMAAWGAPPREEPRDIPIQGTITNGVPDQ